MEIYVAAYKIVAHFILRSCRAILLAGLIVQSLNLKLAIDDSLFVDCFVVWWYVSFMLVCDVKFYTFSWFRFTWFYAFQWTIFSSVL